MGANEYLVFRAPEVRSRMSELLRDVEGDATVRQMYLRDPIGVINRAVFPDQEVPASELSRGNRLLFALLTNEKFLNWSRSYEIDLTKKAVDATNIEDPSTALRTYLAVVDRSTIHQDLAVAAAEFADPELIAALTWRPDRIGIGRTKFPINADVAVEIETLIYVVIAVAVAVAAVAVAVAGVETDIEKAVLNRQDVVAISQILSEELIGHAAQIRESGQLLQFSRRNQGFIR